LSRARLEEHRRVWAGKPLLARLYAPWFEALLAEAARGALVVEVGAGPGTLRAFARERRPDLRWLATDIEAVPWNDVAADAGRLPVRGGAAQAVLGFDVLHHLADPAAFFCEAARVLGPGGRLALVEPWISPLSWPIYRFVHEEDCRLGGDPWRPFPGPDKASFDGDAALPWRILRDASESDWRRLGLGSPRVRRLNAFGYLLSLGFRRASLLPLPLAGAAERLDRVTAPLAPLTALRAVIVWDTLGSHAGAPDFVVAAGRRG
jgi:SAM-dependent methyltransferase